MSKKPKLIDGEYYMVVASDYPEPAKYVARPGKYSAHWQLTDGQMSDTVDVLYSIAGIIEQNDNLNSKLQSLEAERNELIKSNFQMCNMLESFANHLENLPIGLTDEQKALIQKHFKILKP